MADATVAGRLSLGLLGTVLLTACAWPLPTTTRHCTTSRREPEP